MPRHCDVLTITPNPSIDLLHEAAGIVWDDANRVDPPRRRAGGQGVNVARAVRSLGGTAHALLPLGGTAGAELRAILEAEGVPVTSTDAGGETRIFVAVHDTRSGRNLLINPRGPAMSAAGGEALLAAAADLIARLDPAWVACCGSLPPGVGADFYARVKALAVRHGARFVADCDGEALRLAEAGGCDLLKPNRHEAARLTGVPIADAGAAAAAGRALVSRGTDVATITLGADGALLATAGRCVHARVTVTGDVGSAVGAGDSFLAALLLSLAANEAPESALRDAVAAGASVLHGAGGDLMNMNSYGALRAQVELVEIE